MLTRDIISPVKSGVEGLDEIIKNIEDSHMKEIIYPLIPSNWVSQLEYYTMEEFESKILIDNKLEIVSSEEIDQMYNIDKFSPYDGKIIRVCDHMSAFLEAHLSVQNGIQSQSLLKAIETLYDKYKSTIISGVDFGLYFVCKFSIKL